MGDICVAYTVSTSLLLIRCVCSAVSYSEAPGTVAHQASLSMGFSRQEYRSGLPSPTPGDLPNTGVEPESLASSALAGGFLTTSATWTTFIFSVTINSNPFVDLRSIPLFNYRLQEPITFSIA